MTNNRFYIVDVFAEEKYHGNQLAVFPDASDLDSQQMQAIAREINFSETTFIMCSAERNQGFDVRIFTPAEEIPFAGHPTLGTAYVIRETVLSKSVTGVKLKLKVGQIRVRFEEDRDEVSRLWMRQKTPVFGDQIEHHTISPVIGLKAVDLDERFPVQQVSTGLPFFIVPLKKRINLERMRVDSVHYDALIRESQAKAVLAFCPETYQSGHDLSVRVFAPYYGIPEDPATGSANGCLAAYLVEYNYFDQEYIDIRVEQGIAMGRPSLLFLKARHEAEGIAVEVGGRVIPIAEGKFY
jgi:trans-2,3-dihydro-3-hydroxyanthranilate isomerase